jgi:tRNA(Arg) A34 adenosine deaminase TadA
MINIFRKKEISNIIKNAPLHDEDFQNARNIILNIHKITAKKIAEGYGPFYAEIYDENGNFVAGEANSVMKNTCSHLHAEINTIAAAERKFNTYDLGKYNLTMYVNAEPCIMCVGASMWSGIKTIYYSVPSCDVEKITGFDEGFKPNWQDEFAKRGIKVYGNIESDSGKKVLQQYVDMGKKVYTPTR